MVPKLKAILEPLGDQVEILQERSILSCLEKVFSGQADALVGFPSYQFNIAEQFFTNIVPAFVSWDDPAEFAIGIRSDWPELVEILNLGIENISEEERNKVISRWSVPDHRPENGLESKEEDWLARHPAVPVLVVNDSPPFAYNDLQGRESGIYIDFLKELENKLGTHISILAVPFEEFRKRVLEDRSAILAIGAKDELGTVPGYEWTEPLGYAHTSVFTHRENRDSIFENRESKTFGYSGAVSRDTPGFETIADASELVPIQDPDSAISNLLSGEIDGYFAYYPVFNHYLLRAMSNDIQASYVHPDAVSANFLVKEGNAPLLSLLNRTLAEMEEKEIPRLLEKWRFKDHEEPRTVEGFSEEEKEWLSTNPTIRVGADGCLTPITWMDANDRVEGMSVDFLNKVSEMTGVKFEYVCPSSWRELPEMLLSGEIDMVAGAVPIPSRGDEIGFSDPIVTSPAMVFAEEEFPLIEDLSELSGRRVGVVEGGALHEWVRNDHPLLELVLVRNSHEGIDWLAQRKVDVFIGDLLTTNQRIKRNGLTNIKVVGSTPYQVPRSFAVRKGLADPFLGILHTALHSIPESERTTITDRWVSFNIAPMVDYSLVWKILLAAALVIGLVLYMNYRLARKVSTRTADLSAANDALKKSEANLKRAQEVAHIGSWIWEIAEDRVYGSDEVHRIVDIPKDVPMTFASLIEKIHPDDRDRVVKLVEKKLENGNQYEVEHRILAEDQTKWVQVRAEVERDATGKAVTVLGVFHDVTERKRSEEIQNRLENQLRHSQKMEAVGQLAGGVAHDFNNILQAIRGHTDLMIEDFHPNSEFREDLDEIVIATDRATSLVRQLLTFGRKENLQLGKLDLNATIENLLKMVRRLLGEHIELTFRPTSANATIFADQGQIEQIVMNLSVNARDAMPEGGKLVIETEVRYFDSDFCHRNPMAEEGQFVVLHVRDNGSGIPGEIRERIFEPFFTTKEVGRGSGIGLATVYAAVKNHDGFIQVESPEDGGTNFMICLPEVQPDREDRRAAPRNEAIAHVGNGETLLLAEDEQQVRTLAVRVLERAGYRVISACDGEDAIRKFDEYSGEIENGRRRCRHAEEERSRRLRSCQFDTPLLAVPVCHGPQL